MRIVKTVDDAKVPHGEVELPRGYLHDIGEGDLHRYFYARFRELSGVEEDIIAEDDLTMLTRCHKIVGSCLVSLKDEDGKVLEGVDLSMMADKFLIGDNLVAMIAIRRITNGDKYVIRDKCGECGLKQQKVVDLSTFESVMTEGDPLEARRTFELRDGRELVWEMLTGLKQREWIERNEKKPATQKGRRRKLNVKRKEEGKREATKALMSRLVTVGGEEPTIENLRSLGSPERQIIRNLFDDEGGIDVEFEVSCIKESCNSDWLREVEINSRNFFFPLAMSND